MIAGRIPCYYFECLLREVLYSDSRWPNYNDWLPRRKLGAVRDIFYLYCLNFDIKAYFLSRRTETNSVNLNGRTFFHRPWPYQNSFIAPARLT